ncbi:GlxA family transcriptional regulator [Sneathiella litorea]|uniref:Helix-turn-helix domain-containing protein n=1 Tax=Sneathiella litorea TaxID=2606216 RepID=A0A6L8W6F6_9PROT|nr:helix-turn-helix domain-containing protein [Sneathiella litorea]MZR30726.1 helix-turn-helix domain-containing protein [Sneathiella litorea]
MPDTALRVGFVLCAEFALMSLTGFIEALRHAADLGDRGRKIYCSWTTMSPQKKTVKSSCGIIINPDTDLIDADNFDCIVIIGPLLSGIDDVPQIVHGYLRRAHQRGKLVAGLCTGSFVLADAGLMKGRIACLHPYHLQDYKELHPKLRFTLKHDYLEERNIATVPGGLSVVSFATNLISRHCGRSRAAKSVFQMTMSETGLDSDFNAIVALDKQHIGDHRIRKATIIMEREMFSPGTVASVAERLGLSERQMERLFQKTLSMTPKAYWTAIRIKYGKWCLLNTQKTITEIALLTGFADCAHFIKQFRKVYGETPGHMRRLHAQKSDLALTRLESNSDRF